MGRRVIVLGYHETNLGITYSRMFTNTNIKWKLFNNKESFSSNSPFSWSFVNEFPIKLLDRQMMFEFRLLTNIIDGWTVLQWKVLAYRAKDIIYKNKNIFYKSSYFYFTLTTTLISHLFIFQIELVKNVL